MKTKKNYNNLYKKRYMISFYGIEDDRQIYCFNNVREILEFQEREINKTNINLINVELCRALKRKKPICRFLTGQLMYVYIIDVLEEEEE